MQNITFIFLSQFFLNWELQSFLIFVNNTSQMYVEPNIVAKLIISCLQLDKSFYTIKIKYQNTLAVYLLKIG